MRSIFTVSAILVLAVAASAKPAAKPKNPSSASTTATGTGAVIGGAAAVQDINNWCMFMPPKPGGEIAPHETDAVPFCTQPTSNAPTAQTFPKGFITAAYFYSTPTFVQVTGLLNITKYKLSDEDQGGQYDMKAPVGAFCHGYSSFVNLIEPSTFNFCIRCCNDDNCSTGRSEAGCRRIVPGLYKAMHPPYSAVINNTIASSTTTTIAGTTIAGTIGTTIAKAHPSSSKLAPLFSENNGANVVANNSLPTATAASQPSPPPATSDAGSFAVPVSVAAAAMLAAVVALM